MKRTATPPSDPSSRPTRPRVSSPPSVGEEGQGEEPARSSVSKARTLRKRATDAERILWSQLHNRKLAGFKFRRQYVAGPYTLDFFCPAAKLSVELDGGQHGFPEQHERDRQRTEYLAQLGIAEVRFWNHQVRRELRSVLATILRELPARTPHLDPLPLPTRGEEKRGRTPPLRFLSPLPNQSRHA